jgi:hypothetical protein
MAKKPVAGADPEYGSEEYQSQSDADTLTKAQEIQNDPDRHAKASKHLEKNAGTAQDAHKNARKQLEKKTKGRMKKAFGGDKDKGTFQGESQKEDAQAESIVHEDE